MTKILIHDTGDMSVGIPSAHMMIDTNIHYDKDEYKQFYDLAHDWFDLMGTIRVCIGENKDDMECWAGKQGIHDKKPMFWKEEQ